jgi:hypothetical protein
MRRLAVSGLIVLAAALGAPGAASAAARPPSAASPAAISSAEPAQDEAASAPSGDLLDVTCRTTKDCVAVGANMRTDQPLVETWNGRSWRAADLAVPAGQSASLNWVSCPVERYCVAVGNISPAGGPVDTVGPLVEVWNGRSWGRIQVPVPTGGYGFELGGVACASVGSCVIDGDYTLAAGGRVVSFVDVLSKSHWTRYSPPGLAGGGYASDLDGIACLTAADCVAVGSDGNAVTPGGEPANAAVAELWNGRSWTESRVPAPAGSTGAWLYGVSCLRSKTCVAVGGQRRKDGRVAPLVETWNPATHRWRAGAPAAAGGGPVLFDVSCPSAGSCLAVGGGDLAAATTSPFALRFNGTSWAYAAFPAPLGSKKAGRVGAANSATSVACLSAAWCVATGDEGNVPYYSGAYQAYGVAAFWNGTSWRLVRIA